ncbi:MAG: LLM class F420-dependent oxidoreductase, partial [Gammaproteobacteria bacterium]|nr:LLM class F420-dependent oxidoreductase [Gammaproteobacteria bacterium]
MHIGVGLRNMGDQSAPATMGTCARAAEDAGMESVWVTDHIAIPPDDAEGSGGRYVEPLVALAWVAGGPR